MQWILCTYTVRKSFYISRGVKGIDVLTTAFFLILYVAMETIEVSSLPWHFMGLSSQATTSYFIKVYI